MFKRIYPFIKVTFLEGIRNRVAAGVIIFSLVSMISNLIIVNLAAQDVGKVAIDFALSSFSLTGLLLILFACGSSLYRDIDKKTICIVLSKAISRKEYILGKFFGYFLTLFFVSLISFLIGILTLYLIKIAHLKYFTAPFSGIFLGYLFSFIAFVLLLSVLIFFTSLTTSSFTAMLLTVVVYFIGNSIGDLREFAESEIATQAGFSPVFKIILRVVHFVVPDLGKFDLKIFSANGIPVSFDYIFFAISYAIIYCTILILLSMRAFERREFV